MRFGDWIGKGLHSGGNRLDGRRRRFAVLALEALEPRELLSVQPAPKSLKADPAVAAEVAAMRRAAIPAVISSAPVNLVDAAFGRIPLPAGPPVPNLQLAANANLIQRPLFSDLLGLGTGPGSNGNILRRGAASPPKTLLPRETLPPPPPGQGAPPTPPPPPNPLILPGKPTSNNQTATSQTEESGSQEARRAHDLALLALFPEATGLIAAPVVPPANAKRGSEDTLANRPGTVR
jgi:hypothetical protein